MAWCIIVWKAIKFRLALSRLKQAKRNAYRQSLGLGPIYPLYERPFRWIGKKIKTLILRTCCRCLSRKPGLKISNWDKIWIKGTLQNEIIKSVVGITVGLTFTFLLLNFLTSQLNFNPKIVSAICIIFGIFLTLGLAFSDTIRCLFILGIPQFFNSKGRTAILAYVLVLAISGPGKNTAINMEILTESLVCGQEMVKNSTSELVALATEPFSVLKNAVTIIISSIKDVLERMNNELSVVIKTISEVVNVIKHAYSMLQSIVNLCNVKLGTPYDRCMGSFIEASESCAIQLGSGFSWMCYVVDLFNNFCYFAKVVDVFCWLPSLVKQSIFEPLKEHFKIFANGFKEFFDVRLNITYKFDHDLTQDKTLSDITRNMKSEIMSHVQWFLDYIDWMDLVVSFFMLLILWKAFTYHWKFNRSEMFDNFYITRGMIRMDLERKKLGRDSVFPLRFRETKLYVQTFSWDMIEDERKQMRIALVLVGLAAVQILSYVLIDYLLFLFLELVRKYGAIQIDTKDALGLAVTVEGDGFLAAMYRSILQGLNPVGGVLPSFDTTKCLPYAQKPNYHAYLLIIFLLIICFVVAILEPYGLRLRHIICGWVNSERIIPRERWLYVHILSSRGSFLTFARRLIHSKMKGDKTMFQVSLMDRLAHTVPCCKRLFISYKKKCFLCGQAGDQEDYENFIECPNCQTVYCKECFDDMESKCTACLQPIDYGDLTDLSEEIGSDSESEPDLIEKCFSRICRRSSTKKRKYQYKRQKEGKYSEERSTLKITKLQSRRKKLTRNHSNFSKETKMIRPNSVTKTIQKSQHSGWLSMAFGKMSSKFSKLAFPSKEGSMKFFGKGKTAPGKSTKSINKIFKPQSSTKKGYMPLPNSSPKVGKKVSKSRHSPRKSPTGQRFNDVKSKESKGKMVRAKNPFLNKTDRIYQPLSQNSESEKDTRYKPQGISKKGYMPLSKNGSPKVEKKVSKTHNSPRKSLPVQSVNDVKQKTTPLQNKIESKKQNSKKIKKSNEERNHFLNDTRDYQQLLLQKSESENDAKTNLRQSIIDMNDISIRDPKRNSNKRESQTPKNYEKVIGKESRKQIPKKIVKSDGHHNIQLKERVPSRFNLTPFIPPEELFLAQRHVSSSPLTVYIEEMDGQDREGVCHHHQDVEPEIIQKFDNVLSEFYNTYPEMTQLQIKASDSNTNFARVSLSNQDNNYEKEGCPGCRKGTFLPHNPEALGVCNNPWWHRNIEQLENETFRKPPPNVSPGLKNRVEAYNKFYNNMPYPPHCNL